jgi:CBS domain-containing protein
LLALPVVDKDNIIEGIITLQDIVEDRAQEL